MVVASKKGLFHADSPMKSSISSSNVLEEEVEEVEEVEEAKEKKADEESNFCILMFCCCCSSCAILLSSGSSSVNKRLRFKEEEEEVDLMGTKVGEEGAVFEGKTTIFDLGLQVATEVLAEFDVNEARAILGNNIRSLSLSFFMGCKRRVAAVAGRRGDIWLLLLACVKHFLFFFFFFPSFFPLAS